MNALRLALDKLGDVVGFNYNKWLDSRLEALADKREWGATHYSKKLDLGIDVKPSGSDWRITVYREGPQGLSVGSEFSYSIKGDEHYGRRRGFGIHHEKGCIGSAYGDPRSRFYEDVTISIWKSVVFCRTWKTDAPPEEQYL